MWESWGVFDYAFLEDLTRTFFRDTKEEAQLVAAQTRVAAEPRAPPPMSENPMIPAAWLRNTKRKASPEPVQRTSRLKTKDTSTPLAAPIASRRPAAAPATTLAARAAAEAFEKRERARIAAVQQKLLEEKVEKADISVPKKPIIKEIPHATVPESLDVDDMFAL